jgi:excisionase family DNA binding protein
MIASMSEAIETPLKAEQLAKILPLHPGTILKWAREGKIPHKRLGPRTIVFMPSEIRAWLESKNGRIP